MADSKDSKDSSTEIKIDDLDEVLNQAKSQIDDFDEFGDDTVEQLLVKDDFDGEDLDDSIDVNSDVEEDEFADKVTKPELENKSDDMVLDDFDISSNINTESSLESGITGLSDSEVSSAIKDLDGQITQADELIEKVISDAGQSPSVDDNGEPLSKKVESDGAEIAGLHAQINQIWADNEELKEKLALLSTQAIDITEKNSFATEKIDDLQKEQRKLAKSIKENSSKPPMLTYIALGIALLSLLTGGILGAMGLGASSDVAGLTELVTTLEEEIEILTANNSKAGVKQLDEKIKLLTAKDDFLNNKLDELNDGGSQSVFLKSVFDDLVKQSDFSKKSVEELTAKVDKLEQGKVQRKPQKKPSKIKKAIIRKSPTKKAISKKSWAVNLVAFRQKWYAKNKLQEFNKKNVAAELIQVKVKGETWYRLRVKGFKSEKEASRYATKVKKTLNLGSVWVTKG